MSSAAWAATSLPIQPKNMKEHLAETQAVCHKREPETLKGSFPSKKIIANHIFGQSRTIHLVIGQRISNQLGTNYIM